MPKYRFRFDGPSVPQISDASGVSMANLEREAPGLSGVLYRDWTVPSSNNLPGLQDGLSSLGWTYVSEVLP
jgi:hypothetical protein